MNTKMMIAAASIVVGSAVFAATPKELADAGDWAGLMRCGYAATTNNMPKDKVLDVADVAIAMSNSLVAAAFAKDGLTDYASVYNKLVPVLPRKDAVYAAWAIAKQNKDAVKALEVLETVIGSKDMPVAWAGGGLAWCMWNGCAEADFLRLATKALEAKDYATASAPFWYNKTTTHRAFVESAELKAWREANYDKVIPKVIAIAKDKADKSVYGMYNSVVFFEGIKDLQANDKSTPNAMKWFDESMFNDINKPIWNNYYLVEYTFGQKMLAAYVKNATDAEAVYGFITSKLRESDVKSALNDAWYKLGANKHTALKTAVKIGNTDKVIDALLLTTDNVTPELLEAAIPLINGVDADYRTADIVRVLKNINAKYTLKLYDDRDTWEPLLSKVRAMIEAR